MKKRIPFYVLVSLSTNLFGQSSVVLPAEVYSQMKANGELKANVRYHPVSGHSLGATSTKANSNAAGLYPLNTLSTNACSCLVPIDTTFHVAEFTDGAPPDYRTDDGTTAAILLPFDICLYGNIYSQFYINNNGNITLDTAYGWYSASGFPDSNFVMIAPFWADADTRDAGSGIVYYKATATHAIIQWNNVGYYPAMSDKGNTFQVIITDGVDSILPAGQNIAFCYGDMQWTTGYGGTNGFGGTPATTGVNKGDGVNSIQMGRFDAPGIAYDGPYANNDGVDFLDNQSFYSNFCNSINMAPIASGLLNCDTIKVCALGDTLYLKELFLAPESSQIVNISVNLNSTPDAVVVSNVAGNSASAVVRIAATAANAGYHTFSFTASDNGSPVATTVIDAVVFVGTAATSTVNPVISGITSFCDGSSSVLSVSPTNYDSYVWSTVSSDTTVMATTSGIYFVTATLNGCSNSATTTVTVHPTPSPVIAGFPYTCSGGFNVTTLYADSLIYTSYLWSNTNTNDSIYAGNGSYWLTVGNAFGCIGSDTITVAAVAGNVLTTLTDVTISAAAGSATYQWLDCNNANVPIAGATSQSFTPGVNGSYSVIVSNGVCADTSGCVTISNIGVSELGIRNYEIGIYPNPTTGELRIADFGLRIESIKITNMLGQTVYQSEITTSTSGRTGPKSEISVDVSALTKGVYFVNVNNTMNGKFVKQ